MYVCISRPFVSISPKVFKGSIRKTHSFPVADLFSTPQEKPQRTWKDILQASTYTDPTAKFRSLRPEFKHHPEPFLPELPMNLGGAFDALGTVENPPSNDSYGFPSYSSFAVKSPHYSHYHTFPSQPQDEAHFAPIGADTETNPTFEQLDAKYLRSAYEQNEISTPVTKFSHF